VLFDWRGRGILVKVSSIKGVKMLPGSIYKLLPYFYIGLGLISALVVDSKLVFFSSVLLVTAGVLVLWMRHHAVRKFVTKSKQELLEESLDLTLDSSNYFPDHERRIDDDREFPVVDDNGVLIPFDRRDGNASKK